MRNSRRGSTGTMIEADFQAHRHPEKPMHPIARIVLGLLAGLIVAFLIDRYVWPGTFVHGAVGVVAAVIVTTALSRRGSAASR